MYRPLRIRLIAISVFAALCMLFSFTGVQAEENNAVVSTIKKIDRYSKGLKVGMTLSETTAALGQPHEKKDIPGERKAAGPQYFATWLRSGYSIDAQFGKDDRILSYGIHWFGKSGSAPEFNDLLEGKFTEASTTGTRTATLDGAAIVISWRKTPVPGSDKFIDVLTIGVKNNDTHHQKGK
ncbi:MAG: hypothetical protein Q7T18_01680 [Sedimentisphaerales bacterium]|nr:hypothetical protein [Sedimentisphaerales bacterium]